MSDQANELREMMRLRQEAATRRAPVLAAVASGKGGVGKSMLTLGLAMAMRQRDRKVLVIDADFGFANIDVMMGVTATHNLAHVLKRQCTMEQIVYHTPWGVDVISGGSGVQELFSPDGMDVRHWLEAFLRLADGYDYVLFDMGAGVSEATLQVLSICNRIALVVTPEPTSVLDAYALCKAIGGRSQALLQLIVNRAETRKEGERISDNFVRIVERFLHLEVQPLGTVRQDADVPRAIRQQKPLLQQYPGSQAAECIREVADRFLGAQHKATARDTLLRLMARFIGA